VQGVNGDLFLSTESNIGGDPAMVLKNGSGNLGIGTADPFSQLEIVGNAPFITLRDLGGDPVEGGHGRCFIQGINGNMVLKPSSGDAHAMVLKSGAGVGIGTSLPLAMLHVVGRVAPAFRVDGPGTCAEFRHNVAAQSFIQVSDRNAKANFSNVNTRQILEKLTGLPIQKWNYRTDPTSIHHIGPTAQDFQAAFELNGDDDVHISSVDAQGVALAAIQGLNEKLNAENEQLRTSLVSLEARLAAIESNLRTAVINAVDNRNGPPRTVI